MASLEVILTAYAETLADAVPKAASGQAVTFYDVMPPTPNLPAIVCYPTSATWTRSLGPGNDDEYEIAVAVLVSMGTDGSGQRDLAAFCDGVGPHSIRRALVVASKYRHQGQMAALAVPHLRLWVDRMDSWGTRFAQVSVDHLGAVIRTTAITWATDQYE